MKHQHVHSTDGDLDINVHLPTQEIEALIDKATNAAVTIIVAYTAAEIIKSVFNKQA